MRCSLCGEAYEAIFEFGKVHPVAQVACCTCPVPPPGTSAPAVGNYGKNFQFTTTVPVPTTCICTVCGDVFPAKMAEQVAGDPYCPVCFNIPPADPGELVADLRDLEQELRPTVRDGG